MILDIFDASALVYSGSNIDSYRYNTYYNYPIGGIQYAFKYLAPSLLSRHHVVVAFDSKTFRKDIDYKYKSNRGNGKIVHSQLETLYDGLCASNVACYKVDSFEADDIIHWAVKQNKTKYDEVVIYGNDYDLCHNVDFNVRFRGITTNVNSIYYGTFSKSIKQGETIMFNTIAAYKVFCGDSSDCIPAFKSESGKSASELYKLYVKFLNDYQDEHKIRFSIDYLISVQPIAVFINTSGLFSNLEKEELYKRIQLVYPAECPADLTIDPSMIDDLNKEELSRFLNIYGDKYALSCFNFRKIKPSDDDIDNVKQKARQLLNGEYEVDRNKPIEDNMADYEDSTLFLREF